MGRLRESGNTSLPPRMHKKRNTYFYVTTTAPRQWISLGNDLVTARLEWARLENANQPSETLLKKTARFTIEEIGDQYFSTVALDLAPRTQRDYARDFSTIRNVFGHMRFEEITRAHLVHFRDAIAKRNRVGANQSRAFFSALWSFGLDKCLTDSENLAIQVKKVTVKSRDKYVSDEEFRALLTHADEPLRLLLKCSLLLGQRPADIYNIRVSQIDDEYVSIVQSKTGKALRIRRTGELAQEIEATFEHRNRVGTQSLVFFVDETGEPMSKDKIRFRFDRAREAAGVKFRLVDLRAKAATDIGEIEAAQKLLGHNHQSTTRIYRRDKRGEIVDPLR